MGANHFNNCVFQLQTLSYKAITVCHDKYPKIVIQTLKILLRLKVKKYDVKHFTFCNSQTL